MPTRAEEPSSGEMRDISLFTLLNACLRHRRLIVRSAIGGLAIVAAYGLFSPRKYASSSTFMPRGPSGASALTGIASQFGLTLPTPDPGQSPEFYVDLLQSREILDTVILTQFPLDTVQAAPAANLIRIYDVSGATPGLQLVRARKRLAESISASIRQKTGVVTLTVRAPSAALAKQINVLMLDLVSRFNLQTRQSQASAERAFTEKRLLQVKDDLRLAEDRLQRFLQQNRDYRNSPGLTFEQERLARSVGLQQQIFTTLAQALERSKIDEVRDTPVITLIELPSLAVRSESQRLIIKGVLALLLFGMAGGAIGLGRDAIGRERRSGSTEAEEFDRLTDSLMRWLPLRRRPPSSNASPGE